MDKLANRRENHRVDKRVEKRLVQVAINGVPVRANVLGHAASAIEALCRRLAAATGQTLEEVMNAPYAEARDDRNAGVGTPAKDVAYLRQIAAEARKEKADGGA